MKLISHSTAPADYVTMALPNRQHVDIRPMGCHPPAPCNSYCLRQSYILISACNKKMVPSLRAAPRHNQLAETLGPNYVGSLQVIKAVAYCVFQLRMGDQPPSMSTIWAQRI